MRWSALVLATVFAMMASGCNGPTSPSSVALPPAATSQTMPGPTSGPPPIPTGTFAVTGVIRARTPEGDRPLSGANVNAWVQTATVGYSYWYANGPQTTDAQGRYRLANLPAGATVQLQTWKEGFVQQCAAPNLVIDADLPLDVELVSRGNLSASPDSVPRSAPGFRWISGVIYEITANGRQAAPNAFVAYETVDDFPAATAFTDAEGRFLLCGIPEARVFIGASLGTGRVAYQVVPAGTDTSIEIDVK